MYRKFHKSLTIVFPIVSLAIGIFILSGPTPVFAATSPSLGGNSTYGIISSTYTNSLNAALETAISGDICYTTGPSTTPVSISGATVVPCADARGTDQSSVLNDLNAQADLSCNDLGVNVVLSGTYTPGCYSSSGTMNITLSTTVTLDGAGTYIFRSGGTLTTGANSVVALAGGASAADVFWVPNGHVVIGANSSTSATPTFVGNIIQNSLAAFDVTIGHFVNLLGRVMAFGRTVTTDSVTIAVPGAASLRVIGQVTNNNGGTAAVSDFNLHVKLSGTDVVGSPAAGTTSPGNSYSLGAGTYVVSEDINAQYTATISGDCAADGTITLAVGENKTCTITNDDIAPQLIVNKVVINDSGGTKIISDFPLFIDNSSVTSGVVSTITIGSHTVSETSDSGYADTIGGNCAADGTITLALGDIKTCTITNDDIPHAIILVPSGGGGSSYVPPVPPLIDIVKVPSPLALPNGPGTVKYIYTLRNIGTVPVSNITMVGDTCSPIALILGDTNTDAKLDTNETWVYTCSGILTKTHTNIITASGWANGISATDIANATVIVGVPVVSPLIHVTKTPNPLVLFAEGGMVTYTNKVTNPGTVALSNVRLTDDKCGPVEYISGDINGNSALDTTETWTYTCQTTLLKTTVNTITAEGTANGLTAKDFAIATVVVGATAPEPLNTTPKLPNAGLPPREHTIPWYSTVPAVVFSILALFYFARKKLAA